MRFVATVRDIEQTRLQHDRQLRDLNDYGFGLFATILKSDQTFIGRCGLDPEKIEGKLQGELAWMFFPKFWGNGITTEFGTKMPESGFGELSLPRIFAHARRENVASISVMKKIGMQYAGCSSGEAGYEVLSAQ